MTHLKKSKILPTSEVSNKNIKAWLSKGRAAAFTKFQPIWKSSKYSLRTKINLYSNVGEIKQRRMRCLGHVFSKKQYSDFGGGKKII